MKKDRLIYYLGSSITRGHGGDTDGVSFADLYAETYGGKYQKEAVSGTNLVPVAGRDDSYVERLRLLDFSKKPDLLVVQLSTNDFTNKISEGEILSALEYLFIHSDCPNIVVYTCPLAKSWHSYSQYEDFIDGALQKLLGKWKEKVRLLDLFHSDFALKDGYLQEDGLHPTRKGYALGFLPKMHALFEMIR
ncbi:MAG: SGNH/GDSL hydrolase family protein [Clostridia bacterium]|nr:SGNH/GDSL hydrolase family protein [Clostridia bacterium]